MYRFLFLAVFPLKWIFHCTKTIYCAAIDYKSNNSICALLWKPAIDFFLLSLLQPTEKHFESFPWFSSGLWRNAKHHETFLARRRWALNNTVYGGVVGARAENEVNLICVWENVWRVEKVFADSRFSMPRDVRQTDVLHFASPFIHIEQPFRRDLLHSAPNGRTDRCNHGFVMNIDDAFCSLSNSSTVMHAIDSIKNWNRVVHSFLYRCVWCRKFASINSDQIAYCWARFCRWLAALEL